MGDVIKLPGTFCEICHHSFTENGRGRQSQTFGFCCERCVNKSCRLVRRHNRRARAAGVKGTLFPFDWLSLVYAHNFSCAGCAQRGELTLDHIRPLSVGGANLRYNIQPLCSYCHQEKDNIRPREAVVA